MARKTARRTRGKKTNDRSDQEQVRPKGPAAAGHPQHQGTRTYRRTRSN